MRAVVLEAPGGPERLRERDVPMPVPRAGELLVRVRACGVCGHDLLARRGALGTVLPQVLGHEIAGEVAQADPTSGFAPGDRVVLNQRLSCGRCASCHSGATNRCVRGLGFYGDTFPGGYAEYVRALPANAVRLPGSMPFTTAAALPCGIATGYHALDRLAVTAGETILVTGAGGGVGLHAVALVRRAGGRALGVVRDAARVPAVRAAGAEDVVVSSPRGFHTTLRERGEVPDAVVECVGTPTLGSSLRAVRAGGRVALVGNVAPAALAMRLGMVILKELDVLGSSHATVAELAECVRLVAAGEVVPRVESLPLAAAAQAHALMERGAATGKVVLAV